VKTKRFGIKALGGGAEVTDEILAAINRYALTPLTADDVYVRKFLLAHNAIDRDNERFPDQILDDFAATLPGKGLLTGHKRPEPGVGLWFDAWTEEMSPAEFNALTGEEAKLPDGAKKVKALFGRAYILRIPENESIIKQIDGGVYRHGSIGFSAADLRAVKNDPNGSPLYWEYVPPGEATEASLVWLGAQPGAGAQKAATQPDTGQGHDNEPQGGKKAMKEFLKKVSEILGKTFGDEDGAGVLEAVKAMKDELKQALDRVAELEPMAEIGQAYRDSLVDDYVRMKALLKEAPTDEDGQKKIKAFAGAFPFDFLRGEVKALERRINERFPDNPQLKGGDPESGRKAAGDENPLIPKEG